MSPRLETYPTIRTRDWRIKISPSPGENRSAVTKQFRRNTGTVNSLLKEGHPYTAKLVLSNMVTEEQAEDLIQGVKGGKKVIVDF